MGGENASFLRVTLKHGKPIGYPCTVVFGQCIDVFSMHNISVINSHF